MLYCLLCTYFFIYYFFFFNDTATTEIYTLSLHDALPASAVGNRKAISRVADKVFSASGSICPCDGYPPAVARRQYLLSNWMAHSSGPRGGHYRGHDNTNLLHWLGDTA